MEKGVLKRPPEKVRDYLEGQAASFENRAEYWRLQAGRLTWEVDFEDVFEEALDEGRVEWFKNGRLSGCRNALDVNIQNGKGGLPALVYLPRNGDPREWSFDELLDLVVRQVAALDAAGLREGDRLALWCEDRPESVSLILACNRLGVTAVPISRKIPFAPVAERVLDSGSKILFYSGLGEDADRSDLGAKIRDSLDGVKIVCFDEDPVVGEPYTEWLEKGEARGSGIEPVSVDSEHPLMILYADSSAGGPKGLVFPTGGYLVGVATSYDQIFGVAADGMERIGVLSTMEFSSGAGMSYGLWGPLLNGHTVVIAERSGELDAKRLFSQLETFWPMSLLTTPRMLAGWRRELGDFEPGHKLRFNMVASSGEMLTPRLARFGSSTLVISPERMVNMWVQKETGTALLSTYPFPDLNKPGSVGMLAYGVKGEITSDFGESCRTNESGQLVFPCSWPSMVRSLINREDRFREIYFQRVDGRFSTNDGMRVDEDGFFWFMRRLDDVVKVKGHSVSTSEVEAVLLSHPDVDEAAVIGLAQEGGDALAAFVVPGADAAGKGEKKAADAFEEELSAWLRGRVGEFFVPSRFFVSSALPRTKSGKVVRRLLNRIASGDADSGEDLSYLANPEKVKDLINGNIEDKGE